MPYKRLPRKFKKELVITCVVMLNTVPRSTGLSLVYSPWTLVTGRRLDYTMHCRVRAGEYCVVDEEFKPRNSTQIARESGAIAVGPYGNLHGTYRFMYFSSGEMINRKIFRPLPITTAAQKRLEELSKKSNAHI